MQFRGRTSTSLDDLSLPNDNFSSEAGEVLTFLLTFCVKTKSKSGFKGRKAPFSQLAKVELISLFLTDIFHITNKFTTFTKKINRMIILTRSILC